MSKPDVKYLRPTIPAGAESQTLDGVGVYTVGEMSEEKDEEPPSDM
jgi:hypothetical protein